MMWLRKLPPFVIVALVLALAGLMLCPLVIIVAIGAVEGWQSKALDSLPSLFWTLYTLMVAMWIVLVAAAIVLRGISRSDISLWSIANSVGIMIFGAIYTCSNLLMPIWTGGRLLGLTIGAFMLTLGMDGLIRYYIAKRRYSGEKPAWRLWWDDPKPANDSAIAPLHSERNKRKP